MMQMKTDLIVGLALVLLQLVVTTSIAMAESRNDVNRITDVKGRIEFSAKMNCYTLVVDDPPTTLFIVNPNKKILERLKKIGKQIDVRGHFQGSADYLIIDQIDGKHYSGNK